MCFRAYLELIYYLDVLASSVQIALEATPFMAFFEVSQYQRTQNCYETCWEMFFDIGPGMISTSTCCVYQNIVYVRI